MFNPFNFTHKKIVITGGTSGIGLCCANALAAQGAALCLVGRNEEKLSAVISKLNGSGHSFYIKDLSEPEGFDAIFNQMAADGKKIDGLLYSAGIGETWPISAINRKRFEKSMCVNLYSFIEMVKLTAKNKYGVHPNIVGISSVDAVYPGSCQTIYASTKAAMNAAVNALALELSKKNIRINTIMPGWVDTPMTDEAFATMDESKKSRMLEKQILDIIPPEDIANIAMFLLSDASRCITGRSVYADGGYLNF